MSVRRKEYEFLVFLNSFVTENKTCERTSGEEEDRGGQFTNRFVRGSNYLGETR